jgi:predicted nucleotidyltransferase
VKPAVRLRELASEYTALLRSAFGNRLVSVVLYGPVARGDAPPGTDLDLLVVVAPLAPGPFKRKDLLAAADDAIAPHVASAAMDGVSTRIARIVKSLDEARTLAPLYVDLVEDAVLLHDRDGFFAAILADIRRSLDSLGARRVREGGAWYWEL